MGVTERPLTPRMQEALVYLLRAGSASGPRGHTFVWLRARGLVHGFSKSAQFPPQRVFALTEAGRAVAHHLVATSTCAAAAASGVCLVGFRRLITSPGPPFAVLVTKRTPCDPPGLFSWQEAVHASVHAADPSRPCHAPNPPLTPVKGPV